MRELPDLTARAYLTLRTALALRAYDRGKRANPGRHASPERRIALMDCAFPALDEAARGLMGPGDAS